ncbi:MAG: UvrD-helicase domain-containing protein [Nitrospirae bacterium]|nr:UvrD-helicase domain-containing protein [Nitrospirota bacterium]
MSYLNTDKSVIISSPAGSGKTEKLARRYIALLKSGAGVERILAVTFTDKAAAEMKQRILTILKTEDSRLFDSLLEKMPLMRVSTIHSFCGTLLRRFSFEAGIDANYRVENAIDARIMWEEIIYELLMEAGAGDGNHELFLQTIGEKGFRGLANLSETVNYLYEKRPFSLEAAVPVHESTDMPQLIEELLSWEGAEEAIDGYRDYFTEVEKMPGFEDHFLTKEKEPRKKTPKGLGGIADYKEWAVKMHAVWKQKKFEEYANRALRIREIFKSCLKRHELLKSSRALLDFSDLEYIAYRMLTEEPEWANILYAFDEKTDHILVDEFQDTNNFQWAVIDRLTEEWRSGLGAKRDEGIKPTVFLVGDRKQSIYYFRGANVEIFRRAKEKLSEWLGDEFYYEEVKENYRSAPAIIEFTNAIFSKIMSADNASPAWMTEYGEFEARRKNLSGNGSVEIIMLEDADEGISLQREREADVMAKKINGLVGSLRITERKTGIQRECTHADIAILLRKRTHLKKYEEALARHGIPFIAVKGIGFYQEPEVAVLRALVYFLSNTKDDYSLYVLLKSPLFNIDEGSILQFISNEGDSLFGRMKNILKNNPPLPPFAKGGGTTPDSLCREGSPPLKKANSRCLKQDEGGFSELIDKAFALLQNWLIQSAHTPLAELIERALVETGAWRHYHEPQQRANIKKFIRIMEETESGGRPLIKIRAFLERTIGREDEAKANVNTAGMNAVKILTIHTAKGLEFPVVFLPAIEDQFTLRNNENLVYEKEGKFFFKSVTDAALRRGDEDFRLHLMKEEEEQKRLFYVAVTRAEEALFLVATWKEKGKSFLSYLKDGIGLEKIDDIYSVKEDIPGLSIVDGAEITAPSAEAAASKKIRHPHAEFISTPVRAEKEWKTVTGGIMAKGKGMKTAVPGEILHEIFEKISIGDITDDGIAETAASLFISRGMDEADAEDGIAEINKTVALLKEKGIWQSIIQPVKDSFAELPFIFESGSSVYRGRIDRVIKDGDVYNIYDYKTFPVTDDEIADTLNKFSFQLDIYKKAVKKIFDTDTVKSFIVFTHTGEVREV